MDIEKPICLSQSCALARKTIRVNRATGTIENVAILTKGEAIGHGFIVDDKMLEQAMTLLRSNGDTASHLTHDHKLGVADPILTIVGGIAGGTVRIDSGSVRGTLKLGDFAAHSPAGNGGDIREYLLGLAEERPQDFGLSITFAKADYEQLGRNSLPAGRIKKLFTVDFVGTPGANPNGLLSAKDSDQTVVETLVAKGYLRAGATIGDAVIFLKGMAAQQECDSIVTPAYIKGFVTEYVVKAYRQGYEDAVANRTKYK